ncbi:MAG: hypothetical protein ACK5ML_02540 [Lachnospiraceae bacterium]
MKIIQLNISIILIISMILQGFSGNYENDRIILKEVVFSEYSPEQVLSGYDFSGLYADQEMSMRIDQAEADISADQIVYQKWTRKVDSENSIVSFSYRLSNFWNSNTSSLKNCDYRFEDFITIPGLPATVESDLLNERIVDSSLCLQGLAYTDEFILISSYSANSPDNPGCIHVIDRQTGEYLVSIGLRGNSHMGGIAFDGQNIWVCNSDNNTMSRISYSIVKSLAQKELHKMIDCTDQFFHYKIDMEPSCVTFSNGKIWIATHTVFGNSKLGSYIFEQNQLTKEQVYQIPSKVQGITFDDKGRVYLSTSYGRKNSSFLHMYQSLADLDQNPNHPSTIIEMPPCSEEIEYLQGELLILFESACQKYFEGADGNGISTSPIDKILCLSTDLP